MWQLIDIPNALTLLSLIGGVGSAFFAIGQNFPAAIICLIVSGVCDLFDGLVARKVKRSTDSQQLGQRLDSLVDGCAFGFAPAVLLFAYGLNDLTGIAALILLAVATVLRVGYYDATGLVDGEGSKSYYQGLPCTYVALVLPLVLLSGTLLGSAHRIVLLLTVASLAVAMTTRIPIRKPRGVAYVGFAALAVAVCAVVVSYPTLITELRQG